MAINMNEVGELVDRVVYINRVAKVVKGGRRFSFTALVAVGDEDSVVGIGYGKAREVPLAIQKGVENARKDLIRIPKYGQTITHKIIGRYGAGHVVLRPASPGTGVIAGGGVRAVLELGGVKDVLTKSIGTQNPINLVKATMDGLIRLRRPEEVAELRGLTVSQVLGVSTNGSTAGPVAEEDPSSLQAAGDVPSTPPVDERSEDRSPEPSEPSLESSQETPPERLKRVFSEEPSYGRRELEPVVEAPRYGREEPEYEPPGSGEPHQPVIRVVGVGGGGVNAVNLGCFEFVAPAVH